MSLSADDSDAILKSFGRAFFKQNMGLMYQMVTDDFAWTVQKGDDTRVLNSRAKIATFFAGCKGKFENVRFGDVVFNRAPDATFMTDRMIRTEATTGVQFAWVGVERYTFHDGKLSEKEVYGSPAEF